MAWVVWFLDLALVLVARKRIKDVTNGALTGHIGNAVWMGLAAAVRKSIKFPERADHPDRVVYRNLCRRVWSFRSIFIQKRVSQQYYHYYQAC
jgi:hypothetical protein